MTSSIIFFGSSPFSVIVLQGLIDAHLDVKAVVTFPDKPVGRHLKLTPNPVKILAQKYNIPVFEKQTDLLKGPLCGSGKPEQERRPDAGNDQAARAPAVRFSERNYIGLVAAYGRILKPETLSTFNNQIYNIHPSLLPKYRGPSPLQQQILDGISDTGVTIIQLDEQMDHGPIVSQIHDNLLPTDTTQTLGNRLFTKGVEKFIEILPTLSKLSSEEGKIQDDRLASYTHKLTKQDGFVEFEKLKKYLYLGNCELDIAKMHRAFSPWPSVWTLTPSNKRLKLISINPPLVQPEGAPKPITLSSFLQSKL